MTLQIIAYFLPKFHYVFNHKFKDEQFLSNETKTTVFAMRILIFMNQLLTHIKVWHERANIS